MYQYCLNNPLRYTDPDGRFVIAIPLLVWGGTAGLTWVLPSLTTMAVAAVGLWSFQAVCNALDHLEYRMQVEKYREENFPGMPDDLEADPNWIDITHPEQRPRGRRTYKNEQTGEVIEYDKGQPGKPGHRANDHYHRPNPNSIAGDADKYLDEMGRGCSKSDDHYHLYPPEGISWNY